MAESWFEVAFGAHYPEIYAHRDDAEARRCLHLLPTLAPLGVGGAPVLDLGCGDGRHLNLLTGSGLNVLGLDLSAPLLDLASKREEAAPLVRGDMRCLPFSDQSLGTVLSLFTAFGYFGSLKKNPIMVQEVARVLSPAGHWFLDYFNCDRVRRELASGKEFKRERTAAGMIITETRRYCEADGLVSKEVCLEPTSDSKNTIDLPEGGLRYTEKVAVFSLDEMDDLARSQGLIRVASAGSYQGDSIEDGDRWILVYRLEKGCP